MKPILISIFAVILHQLFAQNDQSYSSIIPTPFNYSDQHDGTKIPFDALEISILGSSKAEIDVAQNWFNQSFPNRPKNTTKKLFVHFIRLNDTNAKNDYHTIDFVNDTVIIQHSSEAGKLYGMSSLIQNIQQDSNQLYITPFKLEDFSHFAWRGQHLDVCRHFFSVAEIKRHIDLMAFYKFNTFHWHLTDDQAWRIEIKKYPRLTEIGAFRDSTLIGAYVTNPTNWDLTKHYGGFYTQEQIKEVVNYAAVRNVTVVPEIEMPGHARAALAAYPELGCTGKRPPLIGYWGVFDEIFCSNEKTIAFLQDVLTEVLALFPSEYIHIGGDEAPKTQWKACAVCQNTIQSNNLKDEHELQSWFVRQMDDFLTKKGRKLIGWDEILEGGLSPNAAVMSWQGETGGVVAANLQHEVVMTPTSFCYFDYYQGDSKNEPHAIGGYVPLEKVYNYNPIPSQLDTNNHMYIKGAQANLWTEYIKTYAHVQYMMYPRALALIQNLWTDPNVKPEYADFNKTLIEKQFPILTNWKINYAISHVEPKFEITTTQLGLVVEAQSTGDYTAIEMTYPPEELEKIYASHTPTRFVVQRNQVHSAKSHTVIAREKQFGKEKELTLIHHKGLGLNIDFITTPHKSYSSNHQNKLTDGIQGSRPWKGNEWVGFNDKTIDFTVQLDNEIKYSKVTISLLDANGSWIHLPEKIVLFTSKNGKKWKESGTITTVSELNSLSFKSKYKALKFSLISKDKIPAGLPGEGTNPFTFIDELIFE